MRKFDCGKKYLENSRGGVPFKKDGGVFVGNFEKNPLVLPRTCFVGVA